MSTVSVPLMMTDGAAEYKSPEAHPAADIFPLMHDEELDELADDIRQFGQRVPIVMHEGKILDGRNRWRACLIAGVDPITEQWRGSGSPTTWVISLNLHRRHLTASQRAALALDILPMLEAEAKQRQGTRTDLVNIPQKIAECKHTESREQAADLFKVNRQYVSDAKKIRDTAPDLFEDVRSGQRSITEAKRELKERDREKVRETNRELVAATPPVVITSATVPERRYQTIVLDPPWDWGDEGDADQFGRARPTYDTMSIDEIAALPLGDLSDANAHIYLWITNRSLPKGFGLLDVWGFRYVTMLTWVKPSIGMGNYYRGTTEHVLFGVRGSLPLLRRDVGTHFAAPRPGRHSAKPDAFYELVESCSPGPWLEMFSRQERRGWVAWGAEVSHGGRA